MSLYMKASEFKPKVAELAGSQQIQAVVPFGGSAPPVPNPNKQILGGKGLGLQEMSSIGISVPPGFTMTCPLCDIYEKTNDLPQFLWEEVKKQIQRLEKDMGKKFGDTQNPLLLSCRSGAAISMPGMMDTVLNVGLNKDTVKGLAQATGNKRFAYDSFRRLLDMFGDVVLGIPHEAYEEKLEALKKKAGVKNDVDLSADQLEELCGLYSKVYDEYKKSFPQDPFDQIQACIKAVFGSWNVSQSFDMRTVMSVSHNINDSFFRAKSTEPPCHQVP